MATSAGVRLMMLPGMAGLSRRQAQKMVMSGEVQGPISRAKRKAWRLELRLVTVRSCRSCWRVALV